ncbi:maltose alpha-D-glucosyltransferase [Terrihabitans rhizophilus]|uniref:Maltokinase n=1 Tax=Terrihabitans rhizophilus TaxID=3092662 RepID=A0ABU4RI67_9HYPH|nr:maltose alpha-D-glucosyltransferase [Terrihabitans sp. PJ23]MDX6804531.1 maltose alpha-D-glucosyltransferase [Terrihabitans sp. PJ23]
MIDRSDPQWFRDAVFYQIHVKSFFDSNNDGVGDFEGVTQKLDYIKDLGVTALWVMPFYPSPLRDDGYDIADYKDINPSYGTMRDFRRFIREAHARDLRVVTELVINHTSDQHPWFQRARQAKKGSPYRDFYVWSDTAKEYSDTRIIFLDTEKSNWTWDPVAGAYFWHRFYSHQPDLNFDNPRVLASILQVMRYWLDMGVDGLRLDAIPYLVERDGTNCENLPDTHQVIKRIRQALDRSYPDRMLLAEANQWPEETAPYFGDGDECHMAFHFPLMPRMYMAIAQEDRHPITDIMRQTPEIPEGTQWAIFLRNHDELTLEMVTESERDYLWTFYAGDRRARINLGIRRRLAPLLENDRRKVELLNSLLFSMPGTPFLYYGDEIGMGDNIYLGDRDGVRTPMQWSPDRNGGFSKADPASLFLPAIQDPTYGFQAVNVEAQLRSPASGLNWLRRLVAIRKNFKAFGRGTLRFLSPENRKVLAYLRELDGETLLCVANFSRAPQAVELDLTELSGRVPVELSGGTEFPAIGELPYLLTLPAYGFYWFSVTEKVRGAVPQVRAPELFTMVLQGTPDSLFRDREQVAFEKTAAPNYLPRQRWFAGKTSRIEKVEVVDHTVMRDRHGADTFTWPRVAVSLQNGERQMYSLPLAIAETEEEHLVPSSLARVRRGPRVGLLYDAAAAPEFALALLNGFERGANFSTREGRIDFEAGSRFPEALAALGDATSGENLPRRFSGEQSNTSIGFGEHLVLKLYRRLQPGIHPEIEVGKFLTEVAGYANTPAHLGAVHHLAPDGTVTALAVLQAFVPNQGDAWTGMLEALKRELETYSLIPLDQALPIEEAFAPYLRYAGILGKRTAEVHRAFATPTEDEAFKAEPLTFDDVHAAVADAREQARKAFEALEKLPASAHTHETRRLLEFKGESLAAIDYLDIEPVGALKTRIHGDFHLGQVLIAFDDVYLVDFEGEPSRPAEERRGKFSPMRDVAGMLRSFAYATDTASRDVASRMPEAGSRASTAAAEFLKAISGAFVEGYREALEGSPVWIADRVTRQNLLKLHMLSKAFYEVVYEANNRPDWIGTPVRGVLQELEQDHR